MLAANGLEDLMKYVVGKVESKVDLLTLLNSRNHMGNTPLHWAIINKNQEMSMMLVELGTDPNSINEKAQTPLDIALIYGLSDLIPFLSKITKLKDTELNEQDDPNIKIVKEVGPAKKGDLPEILEVEKKDN